MNSVFMIGNIHYNKKEKQAILKIMLELNNHFDLPRANFIDEVATYLHIRKSKSYNMPLSEAQKILERDTMNDDDRHTFVNNVFSYLLINTELGVSAQKRQFKNAIPIIGKKFAFDYSRHTDNPITMLEKRYHSSSIQEIDVNMNINGVPKQISVETDIRTDSYTHSVIVNNNKSVSYSDKINEILYKDL